MSKVYLIFFCLLMNLLTLRAQNPSMIKGVVKDADNNSVLENANIMILRMQDSIIYESIRADAKGSFQTNNLYKGEYILVASYANYVDFIEKFSINNSNILKDFGTIEMVTRDQLLKEVVVKSRVAAIRIKGDTTEFVADSFKVLPNASVEDLLKKLPGIQVDREGNITAQGQTVKRLLVDGEEFFSADPTLVTRNFRANMVDKVQLYDKKTDQVIFTGIDDGIREKTINLKIKPDKKNGYFGKVEGGYGTADFYQNQLLFNYFKGRSKISAYATHANTGKNGLTRADIQRFSIPKEYNDDIGALVTNWSGRYEGEGIPTITNGGVHFDTKWNEDKQKLNVDVQLGKGLLTGSRNARTITSLGENNAQVENADNNFDRLLTNSKVDADYKINIDSSFSITTRVNAAIVNFKNKESYTSIIKNRDSSNINHSESRSDFSGDKKTFASNLLLQKKLNKERRTISLDLKQYAKNINEDGNLHSEINFYKLSSNQLFNQYKKNISETNSYAAEVSYTEPLSEFAALGFVYQYNYNNSKSDRRTFNNINNNYNILDSLYSNDFRYIQSGNLGGISYVYGKNNKNIDVGIKANFIDIEQENLIKQTLLKRNFIDVNANATYRKTAGKKRLVAGYWGNSIQPELKQLQPVLFTEDSLNIYVGNEFLKPSFKNSFFINYEKASSVFNEYMMVYASVDFTVNPIITNLSINPTLGIRNYSYFNTAKTNYNYDAGISYSNQLQKIDMGIETGISFQAYNTFTSIDNELINAKNYLLKPNLRLSKVKNDLYDFGLFIEGGYNFYKTDINRVIDNNAFFFTIRPEAEVLLPLKMKLYTYIDYYWRQKTEAFDKSFSRCLWNVNLDKRFLKNGSIILRFSVNDLLNQNTGFERNITNNIYYESRYTTIPRYFMLSLIWDFNKMGGMVKTENK